MELLLTLAQVFVQVIRAVSATFLPFLSPKKDIAGKTVLVTGAGQGIGALMAKIISKKGAKLILWDINRGESQDDSIDVFIHSSVYIGVLS